MSGPSDAAATNGCHNFEVRESFDNVVDVLSITPFLPRND